MSTPQEYWDACLIRTWRNAGTVMDAMKMFYSILGKRVDEYELLRLPRMGMPWTTGMRVFTSYYLPKVSDRLWDQDPEKDVLLLKKLSKSKYDTADKPHRTNADREVANEQARMRRNRSKMELRTTMYRDKNHSTDWGVTKGPAKVRMRKK